MWLLPLLCLSFSSDGLTFSSDRKMLIFPLTLTGILRPYFTCLHGMQLCGVFPSCLIPPALQLKKIRSSLGFLKAYLTLRSCFCACLGCIHSPTPQYSGSGIASLGETQPQGVDVPRERVLVWDTAPVGIKLSCCTPGARAACETWEHRPSSKLGRKGTVCCSASCSASQDKAHT